MTGPFTFEAEPFEAHWEFNEELESFEPELDSGWQGEVNRGSREFIRWVQSSLNQIMGLRLAVDGMMGSQTRSAIRSFQQRAGLQVDGVVGSQTEAAIRAALAQRTGAPQAACAGLKQPEVLDRFDFDRDRVKPEIHQAQITRIAQCVVASQRTSQPIRSIRLVGHTDPVGSAAHNLDLGRRRADQVARHLRAAIEQMQPGLASRIAVVVESRGALEPISRDNARNRRVEVSVRITPVPPQPPAPPPRVQVVRKRSSAMTEAERNRFIRVMQTLINASGDPNPFGILVGHHAVMGYNMHGGQGSNPLGVQRFLSWHRRYLVELEQMMRTIDSQAFIPYWDWSTERQVPSWLAAFTPMVRAPAERIQVVRNPGVGVSFGLPIRGHIDFVLAAQNYTDFTRRLEDGPHDNVHVWVGGVDPRTRRRGTMGSIPIAPADPVFWLHHAQVDRIWSIWQGSHPREGPRLSGRDTVLDPWTETAAQVASITALGYTYGP